jgi:hypothetical protein
MSQHIGKKGKNAASVPRKRPDKVTIGKAQVRSRARILWTKSDYDGSDSESEGD